MEQKVKLYPSDNFKNEFYCNIAAWCHLESKKEGKQNVGWYRIRLNNSFVRFQAIHIRAIEVIEDKTHGFSRIESLFVMKLSLIHGE